MEKEWNIIRTNRNRTMNRILSTTGKARDVARLAARD